MGIKVTNNAYGTLSASITSSATTIALATGQGARFPSLGAGDYFYGTLIDTSNNVEIVKVTARSSDTMTVVRAQDNTTARAYSTNDRFELRPTAALFDDLVARVAEKLALAGGTMTGQLVIAADPGQDAGSLLKLRTTSAGDNFITLENAANNNRWVAGTETSTPTEFSLWYQNAGASYAKHLALDGSGRLTLPNNPVFCVANVDGSLTDGAIVKHTRTHVNRGGHYASGTGLFTAPIAGVYEFSWGHIANNSNGVYRMHLEKNGSQTIDGGQFQVRVDTSASGSEYGVGYRTVFLSLAAGDTVNTRADSDEGNSFYSDASSGYVVFSGRLIG